jgi:hypothetical protein
MSLELSKLYFDHDRLPAAHKPAASNPSTSAIHIRRNQDYEISWPEYESGDVEENPASYVAYSIADTSGQAVFVLALFKNSSPANPAYEVKAEGGGVLGPINPAPVTFRAGETCTQLCLPLSERTFAEVGKYPVAWNWYYREQGSADWQRLATTQHQVFLIPSAPELPWSKTAFSKNNPWVELLDICCEIAQGAKDDLTAAAQLTRAINQRYQLRYDIIGGAPRYVYTIDRDNTPVSMFDVEDWMNYVLKNKAPSNPAFLPGTQEAHKHYLIVGCQDTAAALAVMSGLLGASAEMTYHAYFGYLNLVEPIGRGKCNNPYSYLNPRQPDAPVKGEGEKRTKFQFHYYVKIRDQNFDACMKVWTDGQEDDGWLIDLSQADYETGAIDKSTPEKRELNGHLSPDGVWRPGIPVRTPLFCCYS